MDGDASLPVEADKLKTLLGRLEDTRDVGKSSDFESNVESAETLLQMLRLDLDQEQHGPDIRAWSKRLKQQKARWREYVMESKYEKPENGALDLTTRDGLMEHGKKIMDADIKSLQEARRKVEEAKQVGDEVLTSLKTQQEQTDRIYNDLFEISDQVERSKKIMARMLRNVATNKVLIGLVALVFCVVIVIIVLKKK